MNRTLCLGLVLAIFCSCAVAQKPYHGDGMDDYLRFVPIGAVLTARIAAPNEAASDWGRFVVNAGASMVVTCGTAFVLKKTIDRERPDGTDFDSFPSGHSCFAFAGAHILHKEYGHVSPWVSIGGYAVAAATAIDRVARNRHDWLDVTAGAAIGVCATELSYWLGDKLTGKHSRAVVGVSPDGLTLVVKM